MINRYIKFVLSFLFVLIILIISYITFDSSFRRKVLTFVFTTHDYYQLKRLTSDLQNRDFKKVSNKINNYINTSKKFTKEKSYMILGIYEALELTVSIANEQDDFNYLEKPLIELVNMDPKLYKPKVWLARALSDNDYNKSISLLEKAILISPTQEDAYREILRLAYKNHDFTLAKKYCDIYPISQMGGNQRLHLPSFFGSYNLKKFAIKFDNNNNDENFYYHSGIKIGDFFKYEFIPQQPLDLTGLNLYFSFLPGINIQIKEVILHSNNLVKSIPPNKLMFTSKFSYLENNNEILSILSLNEKDDVIRLSFDKNTIGSKNDNFGLIYKVEILMNFKKMELTNNNFCKY